MKILIYTIFLIFSLNLHAHEAHTATANGDLAISLAFDSAGKLWRVQTKNEFVEVSHSTDYKKFSTPVKVNPVAQNIKAMGEVRPKIAIGTKGEIYVAWMQNLKPRFAGYIWFARSMDGGKTFEAPYIVHQDRAEIGHAFEALQVSPNGTITMLWLDSRDQVAAKAAGKTHAGSSIYYAVSNDQGASFQTERKLADSSCECCRIAVTHKPDGTVAALWRHVFDGNERDHMIAEIPKDHEKANLQRATFGHWKIDGCPHHGAALASGGEGERWWGYHMAWFDGGNDAAGKKSTLFYGRMDGDAWVSSLPRKFGNMANQAGHPALASIGETVWLAWREKDAGKSQIWLMKSGDDGKSWDVPHMVMESSSMVDYPALLKNGKQLFLAWNTENQGLKVLPL